MNTRDFKKYPDISVETINQKNLGFINKALESF